MNNYEAIKNMTPEELEIFLDQVYLTGFNTAIYSQDADDKPYNMDWLKQSAEDATKHIFAEDGDSYMLDALTKAIFRLAGIATDDIDE